MSQAETKDNWKLLSAVPRFVVKDFDVAASYYERLGFRVGYRGEGFMILNRDSVDLHMNLDTEMGREGRAVCWIRVSGIDSLYKKVLEGDFAYYPLALKEYGYKEFAITDPFRNILMFAQSIEGTS